MHRSIPAFVASGLGLVAMSTVLAQSPAPPAGLAERGRYLATIMLCADCHTTGALAGKPDPNGHLAGSTVGFQIPELGTFYPPNLTPDRETGLGTWSAAEIIRAVREGVRPDGRILAPMMPTRYYASLTDADARALVAYLKSVRPVRHKVPAMVGASDTPSAPYLAIVAPTGG